MISSSEHLHLDVRLLSEPSLWYWEIRDEAEGRLLESSWTCEWNAYDSADAARRAGLDRLSRLGSP